jgi:hypothetical protein
MKISNENKFNRNEDIFKNANPIRNKTISKLHGLISQVNLKTDEKLDLDHFEPKKLLKGNSSASGNQHRAIYAKKDVKCIHIGGVAPGEKPMIWIKAKTLLATPVKRDAAEVMSLLDTEVLFSKE